MMNEEPFLSIVICTYNREKFLGDALESLARQTASPDAFEVVLVNNNSTDRTEEICLDFQRRHPHLTVRYFLESRQGLSYARNRGISEASGQFIAYIDDDAVAAPELVANIQAFFTAHPQAAAVGGKVLARFEGDRPDWFNPYSASLFFSHYDKGDHLFRYRGNGYPIGCNMTFRADFLREAGGFDVELGRKGKDGIGAEEKELFARLIRQDQPFYYDPNQVVYHQIDLHRTEFPYTHKLAFGLGKTHQKLYCKKRFSTICLKTSLLMLLKLAGAAGLALRYALQGKWAISRHLLWYRWTVLRGFWSEQG